VQKKTDGISQFLTQHFGQQHKVVIMYPDSVGGPDNFQNGITKSLIHFFVGFPVRVIVNCIRRKIVKKRPDGFIAKAMIEVVHFFCGNKNGIGINLTQ